MVAQKRNVNQSFYELDYMDGADGSATLEFHLCSSTRIWLGTLALVISAGLVLLSRQPRSFIRRAKAL